MKIFSILPAYNEAENLPKLVKDLGEFFNKNRYQYRIVVVDDGSIDKTVKVLEPLLTRYHVSIIKHETNRGLGVSIKTGFIYTLKLAGKDDLILTMDADNTHDLAALPKIISAFKAKYDLILASRFVPGGGDEGISTIRRLLSHQAGLIFKFLFPIDGVREYTCSYRGYRSSLLKSAFDKYGNYFIKEKGFNCMLEILVKTARLRPKIIEIPFTLYYQRKKGKSKMNIKKTLWRYLIIALRRNQFLGKV